MITDAEYGAGNVVSPQGDVISIVSWIILSPKATLEERINLYEWGYVMFISIWGTINKTKHIIFLDKKEFYYPAPDQDPKVTFSSDYSIVSKRDINISRPYRFNPTGSTYRTPSITHINPFSISWSLDDLPDHPCSKLVCSVQLQVLVVISGSLIRCSRKIHQFFIISVFTALHRSPLHCQC